MHTRIPKLLATLGLLAFTWGGASADAQNKAKKSFPDQFQEKWVKDGPNVRIKRHQDGSKTVFRRSPDDRQLVKRTFAASGYLKMTAVYRVDARGNPLACKIWDGKKTLLYKVSYAYNRSTGRLEAERMFDARAERLDPRDPRKETPIRVMYYNYDAQGNQTAPEVYTFNKGLRAEDVFGAESTFPHENPFKQE